MRNSAQRNEHVASTTTEVDKFASELSELCRKHGLAIAGQPELFIMERDDYQLIYKVDDQSRLILR